MIRKIHNWIGGQAGGDALWKCSNCGKLDWDIMPDMSPTCGGSTSDRMAEEIKRLEDLNNVVLPAGGGGTHGKVEGPR